MSLYLLYALATWRITSLFVSETGPGEFFARLRYKMGVRYDEHSRPYGTNIIAEGMTCFWCFSIWAGGVFTLLHLIYGPERSISTQLIETLTLPFALSAAAILLDQLFSGSH